jgi:hypothetical protein
MDIKTGVVFGILYSILKLLIGISYHILEYFVLWGGISHTIVRFFDTLSPLLLLLFFISFLQDSNQKNISIDELKI